MRLVVAYACAACFAACSSPSPSSQDAAVPFDAPVAADAGAPAVDACALPSLFDAGAGAPERWFDDVTLSAGIAFERAPVDGWNSIADRMTGGVCVLDADGVAPLDLFFAVRPVGGSGSHLYVARGPLDYADETDARGLADAGDAIGCLALDADGDGDDDLFVTGVGSIRFFRNEAGHFVDASATIAAALSPTGLYMSAAAGDLDGDGDLDVVVAGFLDSAFDDLIPGRECGGMPPCSPTMADFPTVHNVLLRQEPDHSWTDVAATLAPDLVLPDPTLAVAIGRLDGDLLPDIWVGNDLGNRWPDRALGRAATGAFADITAAVGLDRNRVGTGLDSMGWATGDVDGDGRLDHVVTSFEREATAVFVCGADGVCEDRSDVVGTTELADTFRWAPGLVDLDLDGDLDLVEATGHLASDTEAATIGFAHGREQPMNLLVNRGGHLSVPVLDAADASRVPRASRGLAVVDLDDDGRPDVVLAPSIGRPALLHNVRAPAGSSLRVRLAGRGGNRAAAGARVTVTQCGVSVVRERALGDGFLGNSDPRLLFGVPGTAPVRVEVEWPTGETTSRDDVAVGTELLLEQP